MAAPLTLFDQFHRTDSSPKGRTEQDFIFLNRSAQPIYNAIREVVESWFARFPKENEEDFERKKQLRGRFREDNWQHSGAFLELITHEFLNAVGTEVKVEPEFNGLTPDFEATCKSIRILFECTVVNPPGVSLGADKREAAIKRVLDTANIGRFRLWIDVRRHGPTSPSARKLKENIERWLSPLDPDEENLRIECGGRLREYKWTYESWIIDVKVLPLRRRGDMKTGQRAIGAESLFGMVSADEQILDALEKKSSKYKVSEQPYVLVLSHKLKLINIELSTIWENSLMDALFGQREWVIPRDWNVSETPAREVHSFDGFFGSPEKPKNRRISAVLFKRELTHTYPITEPNADHLRPWVLYHHPWAERPLPRGLFPFAADIEVTKTPEIVTPTCTLKELLNLPDIGKETYQLAGGMWEAIVG